MELIKLDELLKTDGLDQQTKLAIIDLVAFGNDPILTQDIIILLSEWHTSEQMDLEIVNEQLGKIKKNAEANQQLLEKKITHKKIAIEDTLKSQEKIAMIRQTILNQS